MMASKSKAATGARLSRLQEALRRCLSRFSSGSTTADELSATVSAVRDLIEESPESCAVIAREFMAAGGERKLVSALSRHKHDFVASTSALFFLRHLAELRTQGWPIPYCGLWPTTFIPAAATAVCETMRAHEHDEQICTHGVAMIILLARHEGGGAALFEVGAIRSLCAALIRHYTNIDICSWATGCISFFPPAARSQFVASGYLESLVSSMAALPDEGSLPTRIVCSMFVAMKDDDDAGRRVAAAGVLPVLMSSLSRHEELPVLAAGVFRILHEICRSQVGYLDSCIDAGAGEAAIKSLAYQAQAEDERLRRMEAMQSTLTMLHLIVSSPAGLKRLAPLRSFAPAVLSTLRCYGGDRAAILDLGCELLLRLLADEAGRPHVLAARASVVAVACALVKEIAPLAAAGATCAVELTGEYPHATELACELLAALLNGTEPRDSDRLFDEYDGDYDKRDRLDKRLVASLLTLLRWPNSDAATVEQAASCVAALGLRLDDVDLVVDAGAVPVLAGAAKRHAASAPTVRSCLQAMAALAGAADIRSSLSKARAGETALVAMKRHADDAALCSAACDLLAVAMKEPADADVELDAAAGPEASDADAIKFVSFGAEMTLLAALQAHAEHEAPAVAALKAIRNLTIPSWRAPKAHVAAMETVLSSGLDDALVTILWGHNRRTHILATCSGVIMRLCKVSPRCSWSLAAAGTPRALAAALCIHSGCAVMTTRLPHALEHVMVADSIALVTAQSVAASLISALYRHGEGFSATAASLRCLGLLARYRPAGRHLMASGAFHSATQAVMRFECGKRTSMCVDGGTTLYAGGSSMYGSVCHLVAVLSDQAGSAAKEQLLREGALPVIAAAIRDHYAASAPPDSAMQPAAAVFGCRTVRTLAAEPSCRAAVIESGVLEIIRDALLNNAAATWNRKASEYAFGAVRNLCATSEFRKPLMACGLGSLAARAACSDVYATAWAACGALFGLACEPANCAELLSCGAAAGAVAALRQHGGAAPVVWAASGILLKLAADAEVLAQIRADSVLVYTAREALRSWALRPVSTVSRAEGAAVTAAAAALLRLE